MTERNLALQMAERNRELRLLARRRATAATDKVIFGLVFMVTVVSICMIYG